MSFKPINIYVKDILKNQDCQKILKTLKLNNKSRDLQIILCEMKSEFLKLYRYNCMYKHTSCYKKTKCFVVFLSFYFFILCPN